jgi:spermidine synthase
LDELYSQAHFNLGVALADLGRSDEAMEEYRRALGLNPELARAHHNLGSELANRGRLQAAIPHFREAVRHAPAWAPARHKLGRALNLSGDTARALEELAEAVRLDPEHAEALIDIAWIRATAPEDGFRDADEAIRLASRAAGIAGDRNVTALDTLAAAYAAAGRFDEAVGAATRALDIASETGREEAGARIAERLALYLKGEPYRETR